MIPTLCELAGRFGAGNQPRGHKSWAVGVVLVVLMTGCAAEGRSSAPAADRTTTSSPAAKAAKQPRSPAPQSAQPGSSAAKPKPKPKPGTVIRTAASDFGEMLFDRSGQAIYLFEKESTKRARCYGACAEAWPPVLTKGEPRASAKTRQGLLGTTRRNDGSTQVTYAGHPLYFYVNEGKNEVLCHNVNQFGALWLVVTPGGDPAA